MTATDEQHERLGKGYPYTLRPELHKALKARGVNYWVAQGLTFWNCPDGQECVAYGYQSNGKPRLTVKIAGITDPEQAIEATLGPREQPPYDKLIEALRRDWDIEASWDGLRRFWYVGLTDEGVRKRDEREATLGRGECRAVKVNRLADDNDPYDICACSECGAYLDPMWHYCGICGRKVVDE